MQQPIQASAPMTRRMQPEDFQPGDHTTLFWLGSGGILINTRGTVLIIDPVLGVRQDDPTVSEAGKRLLVPPPIPAGEIPTISAVLYTHADYDHLGPETAAALLQCGAPYHGTAYVQNALAAMGVPLESTLAHAIGETFRAGEVRITLTPAHHCWPRSEPYRPQDCCGFFIETPDGNIWAPGDSILLEEHLKMKNVDVLFADFSDDPYHFGLENSLKLVNILADAALVMYHYGTYDAPDKPAFNANPRSVEGRLLHPGRLHLPAPGEPLHLRDGVLSRG